MERDSTTPLDGCPGKAMRLQGATAPICFGCRRFGARSPKPAIEPSATLDQATHAWQCPNRVPFYAFAPA